MINHLTPKPPLACRVSVSFEVRESRAGHLSAPLPPTGLRGRPQDNCKWPGRVQPPQRLGALVCSRCTGHSQSRAIQPRKCALFSVNCGS